VRAWPLIVAVVVVAPWAVASHAPAPEPALAVPAIDRDEVKSVALEGIHLPLARLRGVLETRRGVALSDERLARDRAAMERALVGLGYLAAQVAPAIVTRDAAGAAYVSFDVAPGALFHLRRVEVTGPGKDAAPITLGEGDPAIGDRIDEARRALDAALARRGQRAAVALSVRTDLAAAAVDVVLATR
jgi:hypothetical protein